MNYRGDTKHSLQRSLHPWCQAEKDQYETSFQYFPLCHSWKPPAVSNTCIWNNYNSSNLREELDLLHIWGFIVRQNLRKLKTTITGMGSPSGCIVSHSNKERYEKNIKQCDERLNTSVASVFFCRSALRVDQQDLGYIFDIFPNPVSFARTPE